MLHFLLLQCCEFPKVVQEVHKFQKFLFSCHCLLFSWKTDWCWPRFWPLSIMIFTCSALEKKSKCYIWKNLYQQNLEGCYSQCTQSHCVKFSVLKVQCVSWYNLHTAWFCRFGLLLYKPLTEPKPSGIHTLNV